MALDGSGCRIPHKFNIAPNNRVETKLIKVGESRSCYFLASAILDLNLDVIIFGKINALCSLCPKQLQLSCFVGSGRCFHSLVAFL